MKRILIVAGTRPEIIKLAPILLEATTIPELNVEMVLTGQHESMAREAMDIFGLKEVENLRIMKPDQTVDHVFAAVLGALPQVLKQRKADVVLVQGDTTSAVAAALAAFHSKIPVGHVEAGLRSFDLAAPFPEEANRRLLSTLATYHFCPTKGSARNLERESIKGTGVHVTGNTIVDALEWIRSRNKLDDRGSISAAIRSPYVLVTAHRRESFGEGLRNICSALRRIAQVFPDLRFVYPVHLNPKVRGPVEEMLTGIDNIILLSPVSYLSLLTLLQGAAFVLTDSGGIQEEAPSFGKHCIVMRDRTERTESVESGLSELVGAHEEKIVDAVRRTWTERRSHLGSANPYGDGKAATRILEILRAAAEVGR